MVTLYISLINIKSFIQQLCLWVHITHPTPGTLHMVVNYIIIVKIIPDKLYIYRLMLEYHQDWDSCDSSEISAAELTPTFMPVMATTQVSCWNSDTLHGQLNTNAYIVTDRLPLRQILLCLSLFLFPMGCVMCILGGWWSVWVRWSARMLLDGVLVWLLAN